MKNYINLCPHDIKLNDGTVYPRSGAVVRVTTSFTDFNEDGICKVKYGEIENLPEPKDNTYYIVSALVLAATDRKDVIAPATGHPAVIRNEAGQIDSVPGFVTN